MKAESKTTVFQMVTDKIIEKLKSGVIPWRKEWHGVKGDENTEGMAISYTTRRAYSTLNQWLLGEPGEYLTFKQIQDLGGSIQKGEKAKFVVFYTHAEYKRRDEKTGEEIIETYPILRYYNVWHLSQTTGIPTKIGTKAKEEVEAPATDEKAEGIIAGYLARETGLRFQNDKPSDKAYYSPSADKVVVPMLAQFTSLAEYYSTTFHELTHSTSKKERCDRVTGHIFGDADYSREELVAEMGSAMLCSVAGVDTEKSLTNSAGYIQGWMKSLKKDPKMIVWATAKAEKAARYILGEIE